jgi:hypothetical protein
LLIKAITLSIALCLSGCSALDLVDKVNPMKEDKGINTNVQLGKENTHVESKQLIAATTGDIGDKLKAETINKTTTITMPWYGTLMLLLAGVLVMPIEFLSGLKKVYRD